MQITLKQNPDFYTKSKDGKDLTYISKKTGKPTPYKKVRIHSSEHEKPLWGAVFDERSPILSWKGGQMVDVEVEQNGEYLNFNLPKAGAFNFGPRIVTLEEKVKNIEEWMAIQDAKDGVPDVQLGSEDIPY